MIVKNNFLEILVVFVLVFFGLLWRSISFSEDFSCYKPDFLMLGLFFVMMYIPNRMNIWMAWIIGLLADSIGGFVLGNEALQLAFMALIVNVFYRRIYLYPPIQQSLVIVGISLVSALINIGVYQVIFDNINYCSFYNILTNALVWPIFYWLVNLLHKQSYSVK